METKIKNYPEEVVTVSALLKEQPHHLFSIHPLDDETFKRKRRVGVYLLKEYFKWGEDKIFIQTGMSMALVYMWIQEVKRNCGYGMREKGMVDKCIEAIENEKKASAAA